MTRRFSISLRLLVCGFCSLAARADTVDDVIANRMARGQIHGLSLAVVQDGKIVKAQGYGLADDTEKTPVTANTLFQAGSISKAVAAFAALHLVQNGQLSLDADVNTRLRTWKVPENGFTKDRKVTLRGILSHSAGLTVHGFFGYATNAPLPTLTAVLDGARPAISSPIRVDVVPGSKWRYSGGGYTVMQQLVIDVTGKAFPQFMRETVLDPLGMANSTYEQPLPETMAAQAASGYFTASEPVRGRWHVYPEMAAAGLWTTPSDLARFIIGVQQAYAGASNSILSQSTVRMMLTDQVAGDGLGVFVEGNGPTLRFSHDGRNAGFDAYLIAYAGTGQGAVIMINSNDKSGAFRPIVNAIAREYGWSSGVSPIPRPWQRKEFIKSLLANHSRVIVGILCISFGLLAVLLSISRRLLRRKRATANSR